MRELIPTPTPPAGETPCCCAPAPAEPAPSCCAPSDPKAATDCCGANSRASSCCSPDAPALPEIAGYRRWRFVTGFLETPAGPVPVVKTRLERPDRLGAALVRLGVGRGDYRVAPGLYAVGAPGPQSPVLATANYKLSFDALRRELSGLDAWILVLDTKGVNVWCAAGKGSFGTAEMARRIAAVGLDRVVGHRRVVAPQLGAPGVNARAVKAACGFRVLFGPVRAADIPAYLAAGMKADPAMRRVRFPALDRAVVGLVEFANERRTMAQVAAALFVLAGLGSGVFSLGRAWAGLWTGFAAYLLGFLAGNVLTPLCLPWLPGRAFSVKGAWAGVAFGALALWGGQPPACTAGMWLGAVVGGSWYGMHFTGSSTYTSPTGVEREMRRAIPAQAAALALALGLWRWGLGL